MEDDTKKITQGQNVIKEKVISDIKLQEFRLNTFLAMQRWNETFGTHYTDIKDWSSDTQKSWDKVLSKNRNL